MNSLEVNLLQIISTQSEGFLVNPSSSCFVAAGIQPISKIESAFQSLVSQGYLEEFEDVHELTRLLVERDSNDEPIVSEEDGSMSPIFKIIPAHMDENEVEVPETREMQYETVQVVADSGFVITDSGKEALANL